MMDRLVQRERYLDWLKRWRERQMIKVVSGVRRSGKSTLFRIYIDWLLLEGVAPEQILFVNLEDLEFENLRDYHELYRYFMERLSEDGYTYIFIDEVQHCKEFENAVDSLFIKPNVDVYITGSNAYFLSGELATLLSGRYVQIEILPFSFTEYLASRQANPTTPIFFEYLRNGAFPAIAALGSDSELIASYLDGIYSTIMLKDVAQRLGLSDFAVLESVAMFLFSNIGSPVSVKRITDTINSTGRTVSINTVDKYLRALCDSYLFYKVDRYDIRGKQFLKTHGKYYTVDVGLRARKLSTSSPDLGHVLENIVYLELLRRGFKVNIGKLSEKEVDFVADNGNEVTYVQVSQTVLDENVLRRELEPLQKIPDNHPKLLLTLDEIPREANYGGIRQKHIMDWLLES